MAVNYFFKTAGKVLLFFIIFNSLSFSQITQTFDPELQRYFEKKYGYMKNGEYRYTPISTVNSDIKSEMVKKNSIITYTLSPQPNYTNIPLHYDIKKQNTSGSISYIVLEPERVDKVSLKTYSLLDITVPSSKKNDVLKELEKYNFIFAGEENFIEDKSSTIIFGWLEDRNIGVLSKIKNIDRISFSDRNIRAPLINVTLKLKVPNNRDIVVFSDTFIKKISEYGFIKKGMNIISNDKKYRFSIITIEGKIPLDKTSLLIKNPFVIEVSS
jgi:hypothetical protein